MTQLSQLSVCARLLGADGFHKVELILAIWSCDGLDNRLWFTVIVLARGGAWWSRRSSRYLRKSPLDGKILFTMQTNVIRNLVTWRWSSLRLPRFGRVNRFWIRDARLGRTFARATVASAATNLMAVGCIFPDISIIQNATTVLPSSRAGRAGAQDARRITRSQVPR